MTDDDVSVSRDELASFAQAFGQLAFDAHRLAKGSTDVAGLSRSWRSRTPKPNWPTLI